MKAGSQVRNTNKKVPAFFWFMGQMGERLPFYLAAIVISTLGQAMGRIANAWMVKDIVSAAQERSTEGLAVTVAVNFLLYVVSWFTWRFGIVHYNIEAKHGIARVEKMIFSKAMRLPMEYYEKNHSGDFMSRLTFDVERAGDIYTSRLRRLSAAVISAAVYLVPMFYYSYRLTLCLLAVSLLSFAVNGYFMKPMKRLGGELSERNGKMMECLTDILAGMELVKIFPAGRRLLADYEAANEGCCQTQKKTNRMAAALESLNCLFDLLGTLAFLGLGIIFLSGGMIGLGELAAVYTIYGVFRNVFLEIGMYLPQMMNCVANAGRLYEFMQTEEEPERYGIRVPAGSEFRAAADGQQTETYAVEVAHLSFSYGEGRETVKDFSMKVKAGSCVALVGESGCGKSTITKLLLGFYKPESGYIGIFGKNGQNATLSEMRSLIGYVPQEPYLYGVSIAENIAYGSRCVRPEDVPMEEIIQAAKTANAHDFIMALPDGYRTVPGERGNTLSGGEKQRIAIARAVLKNAPVLLLDEATSALDNESERLVNEALDRVCRGRTTIMIAHRSSTIAMADEVVTVGNGHGR